jgi:hypothetical protein
MICTKCKTEGILNVANNQEFYFCRVCRTEIGLETRFSNPDFNTSELGWDTYDPEDGDSDPHTEYFYGSEVAQPHAPNPAGITCPMDLDNYDDGGDYFD